MTQAASETAPRIADRLRGRSLLVTGATGLLAKVFVEKLLRATPDVGWIHLLLRPRSDGLPGAERLEREVLGSPVFDRLRALLGPRFDSLCAEKVAVVEGDLTQDRLGLSEAAYAELAAKIDIVVNSAAAVTFDERLDFAVAINTQGPRRLLAFAQDCNAAAFLQVSTCYVSGRREGDVPEALSQPPDGKPIDLDRMLDEIHTTCDRVHAAGGRDKEGVGKALVEVGLALAQSHGWNDTYTFTKWLGEQFIARDRRDLPVVILRPAIIEGSYEEPVPGWIDGLRMADPIIIAYGSGKLTEFPADPGVAIDIIPVDLVANAMFVALPAGDESPGLTVYQSASSGCHPLRLADLQRYLEKAFRRRPMLDDAGRNIPVRSLRLVTPEQFQLKWSRRLARARRMHAALEQLNMAPTRRRRLNATISRIEQLEYFARIYSAYTHLNCCYCDDRLRERADGLRKEDRDAFPVYPEAVDWEDYFVNRHVPGLRKFALGGAREGDRSAAGGPTLPRGLYRRLHRRMDAATSIYDVFQRTAGHFPTKVALQMSRRGRWLRYTYAQARAAASAVARRLEEDGLTTGDRVVICGENSPEWGVTYLAVVRSGMTAVPLDAALPPDEIIACAQHAGAKLICARPTTYAALMAADASRNSPIPIIELNERWVPPPGAARDDGPPPATVSRDAVASILFTSGTTLKAKAVQLTHENFLSNAAGIVRLQPLGPSDNFLSVLPLHHAFEFTAGFLLPIAGGATITYVEQLKGPAIVDAMQATGTTVMLVVPRLLKLFHEAINQQVDSAGPFMRAMFRSLHNLSEVTGRKLGKQLFATVHKKFGGKLRLFVSGAAPLDADLFHAFQRMGFAVAEGYGLTETAPVLTVNPTGAARAGSAGKPLPNVQIEIRDAGADGVGELWARGPNIMTGYFNDADATAAVVEDGWFRTGDLCRRDADGFVYIAGRAKDLIVTEAGKNVYPDEVEARYKELPHVKELCVVGVPNESKTGEAVHAVVVTEPDGNGQAVEREIAAAAAEIARNIPSHQRIQTFHFWTGELPKTSTLKAKRLAIRDAIMNGHAGHAVRRPAETRETEASPADHSSVPANQCFVIETLSRLTHTPEIDIHPETNLLQNLGVDSLMKLYVVAEVEKHYGFTCTDESAAAVERVRDLLALVGDRIAVGEGDTDSRSWKSRLHRSRTNGTNGVAADGRSLPLALMPARWAAQGGVSLFFNSYVRVRASGLHHVPTAGPFILAANHTSHLDAASVLTAVGGLRRVWVAAAEDYFFDTPLKSWVFGRLFDTIPIDRNAGGVSGLRGCIKRLEAGDGVLVLPEGTRSVTGRIQEFKIGVAVLALESDAPVVPTRIDHAFDLLPKGRRFVRPGTVQVTFGEPIAPSAFARDGDIEAQHRTYQEMTRQIQSCVESLGGQQ